jgi:hypothetical protein
MRSISSFASSRCEGFAASASVGNDAGGCGRGEQDRERRLGGAARGCDHAPDLLAAEVRVEQHEVDAGKGARGGGGAVRLDDLDRQGRDRRGLLQ